jgi:ribosomal protein S18 acetylase RimI-like enzyme
MQMIIIRKATLQDLETLLEFEQEVIAAERPFDSTLKPGHIHYYDIEKMITAGYIELLVAELDKELIGCGYARIEDAKPYLQHLQHGYLGFMYVKPGHRGKGINKMIMDALTNWSASENITELRLDVYHQNESAVKAYEKSGFEKHMLEMRKSIKK